MWVTIEFDDNSRLPRMCGIWLWANEKSRFNLGFDLPKTYIPGISEQLVLFVVPTDYHNQNLLSCIDIVNTVRNDSKSEYFGMARRDRPQGYGSLDLTTPSGIVVV